MDNKATVPEFQGMLESRGVSRRSFMKLCGTLAVMVGLGEAAAPRVAQALEESVIGASQGDLYLLQREPFQNLASGGAMAQLTPYIESGALTTGDIDLTAGYVTDPETGKKYLMGVPTDSLTGLEAYGINPEGCVMGLLASGGNLDNTLKLMQWLIDNMR